jgi:hypothetical protein
MKTNGTSEIKKKKQKILKTGKEYSEKMPDRDVEAGSDSNPPGRRFEKGYLVEKPE